ncbi:tyrosine-type recombinase/integrase [Oerskovia rustica]|uniref:Tyrosine-type recombinase/integrase n=1 Tax=Oerskovia rustica TaxID=2762237 RepID=A0ABR8RTU9_9CELL|nr:tyrosine-type recombinase/integrase [Oerskovia rustica]
MVFTTLPRGRALSPEQDQDWWESIQEQLSLSRRYRVHDCRHTALTRMVASATDLRTVQEFAGHASVTTTALYVHPDLSMTDRALTATMAALAPWRTPTSLTTRVTMTEPV